MPNETLIGEIVEADFEPPDYPDSVTVLVRLSQDVRVGHWYVRMERIEEPTPGRTTLRVTWADTALDEALAGLIKYRDSGGSLNLKHAMAAIDALRACGAGSA